MKKLLLIPMGLLMACLTQAQPVSDNATIPIGVTLNSILRLTVVSGGNIEFIVSTMKDYTDGINSGGANTRYWTKFNVASSVDYTVSMYSEEAALNTTDLAIVGASTILLDNVGYTLGDGAGGALADGAPWVYTGEGSAEALTAAALPALITGPAGDALANNFTIKWRLGTQEAGGAIPMNVSSLLDQSIGAGRYSTNVVLILAPQ